MTCKTVEIRDRGTFIPALAIRLDPADERDRYLIACAGFGTTAEKQAEFVLLIKLVDRKDYDPFSHGNMHTMHTAHQYLIDHFNDVPNGAVIDAEYILGERPEPKISQAEEMPF